MIAPKALVIWINGLLERDDEPIRFKRIEIDGKKLHAKAVVKKFMIVAEVSIDLKMYEEDGLLVFDEIELHSPSSGVEIVLRWVQGNLIDEVARKVAPYNVVVRK